MKAARDAIATLLASVTDLKVLATSRIPLSFEHEVRFALKPMSTSGTNAPSECAALFALHAKRQGIEVGAAQMPLVEEIVRRLDGLPLAIKLAAGRTQVMSVEAILAALSRRFELLTRGDGQPRQQTLENAIDWSWTLLSEDERQAFVALSVFRGAFTMSAAEAVLKDGPYELTPVDLVHNLVEKSLLSAYSAQDGTRHLVFLDTLREYAALKNADTLRREARAAYARFVAREVAAPGSITSTQRSTLFREAIFVCELAEEDPALHDAAVDCALWLDADVQKHGPYAPHTVRLQHLFEGGTKKRGELGAAWVETLRRMGRLEQAKTLCESLLGHHSETIEAQLRLSLGICEHQRGNIDAALAHYGKALSADTDLPPGLEGRLLGSKAIAFESQGRNDEARAHYEDALWTLQQGAPRLAYAMFLSNYGDFIAHQEGPEAAETYYRRGLEIVRAEGDLRVEGVLLGNLGAVQVSQQAHVQAEHSFAEAIEQLRKVGDRRLSGVFASYRAHCLHLQGRLSDAVEAYREALVLVEPSGARAYAASIWLLAALARSRRRPRTGSGEMSCTR